jgi:SAM-dependent methyltransferase
VVLSNLCLHNIEDDDGRAKACREIARVLKPGGLALISDFRATDHYAKAFAEAGFAVDLSRGSILESFPPLRIVAARKPAIPAV